MSEMHLDAPDYWGAFVPGPRAIAPPTAHGELDGLHFAVKDLIDVAGFPTGGGNPDWAATHSKAVSHDAAVVARLRAAGARLVGKTITDELAFSLEGENAHYGTPTNPRAPQCLPGGSSSGSAVAVASHQVDFALGTDTGGSIRVPASFCGIYGIRPSHGSVSVDGVIPFAPSLDTVGWMARTGKVLQRVGSALIPPSEGSSSPLVLRLPEDYWAHIDPACAAELRSWAQDLGALPTAVQALGHAPIGDWLTAYATLQGYEIRQTLGPWIERNTPKFGPDIAPRFASIFAITAPEATRWQAWRIQHVAQLKANLGENTAWVVPTTPTLPLKRTASALERNSFYSIALALNAVAGLAGLPQVTLPLGTLNDLPLGLSIIGPRGRDHELLALAATMDSP